MPASLDAKYYIIPFLIIATYALLYTRKADLKPHSRVKLYATVVFLYLLAVFTFGMAYINQSLFVDLGLYVGGIWVLQGFLIPNSWIDKKYYKWKERRQANNELDKSK
ncbi:hypothetical protein [Alkalihalobacillus sp. AL-G]|uniref:hypothetical protein n=1 Tax=Alkalihalobacillus sp. AL-G TaxID=2926399 RepID=UPI00272C09B6|nr:hypothetical protein [Alkalihalobacillus sp. AL-G]WLD91721.1 hypothetical protein MOJ78_11770 [Alkalihalobacillus sp. AL-G]